MNQTAYADRHCVAKFYRQHANSVPLKLAPVWEADVFTSTEGEPMTIRRAKAFNAILDNSYLIHCPGDLLVGAGNLGKYVEAGTVDDERMAAATKVMQAVGKRNFGSFSDHHAPDYATLLQEGFSGLQRRIDQALPQQDEAGRTFLESVRITLDGASRYCLRWADALESLSAVNDLYAGLVKQQATMMRKLATQIPDSLHEALQLVLAVHHMYQLDGRGAMAFGRMDQYLWPFYESDMERGEIDDDWVTDLFSHFFAKITVDGDVQNIALGGVLPHNGEDAVNPLSYIILEACKRVGQPGGNCSARIDYEKTPRAFVKKCAEVIRTGIGYPAVMNDRLTIEALLECGYPIEDARDHCFVGCIEVFLQGRQAPWSDGRQNSLAKMPEAVAWLAEHETELQEDQRFEAFYSTFVELVVDDVDKMLENDTEAQKYIQDKASEFTSPFMSALVRDCIARGRDMNEGGALYPSNKGYAIMGIASVADALAAVKLLVCERKRFSAAQLQQMLSANFEGYEAERKELLNAAPKFGNADEYVDQLAARFVTDLASVFARHRNAQGGQYWMLIASNVSNIAAGLSVGATPDGRKASEPLSDASSPYFGRDQQGPTSVVRSIARLPYRLCPGGSVVNMKLDPGSLEGDTGLDALASLMITCFRLGGSELQFNTTRRETLLAAMENPEHYENLVVRVSGFSQRYTWLSKEIQRDILARTEHGVSGVRPRK